MQKEHNILSTKIPIYAVERAVAAQAFGFEKTDKLLGANNGVAINGYWIYKYKRKLKNGIQKNF